MKPHTKYRAIPTTLDGIRFASKGEAKRYAHLRLRERAGEISVLTLQPSFVLQDKFTDAAGVKHRAIKYVGDFQYLENGRTVVEDFKGVETPAFKIKAKMFRAKFRDVELRVVK